jgi:competence protein ComEA
MPNTEPPPVSEHSLAARVLRRADQPAVAALVLLALISTVAWWAANGGLRGDSIEVERQHREPAQFLVDVNSAPWPELSQLPEIGETLARRIVESRERDGPYRSIEDLRRVEGIGPRTLDTIRPYLRPPLDAKAVAEGTPPSSQTP